ncbi:DUF2867 domain-containing protein [Streptomyces sp. NPDC001691]|uniref:DUF2867 domain-containing protein n=1 Tax=unclassified Streptomyces TaxID=2593676 RepID=UPI000DEA1941|nr:DUF2867 domain-containing protein [Streptomyces sp. SDr-06]RCH70193.1 DUF2867 domain-containing protein [Streptomyces sp. SDr-06]
MRLPATAHTSRPWRIHEIADDFTLEDVWALPTPGGPDELDRLVRLFAAGRAAQPSSAVPRFLFAVRWQLGKLFGWDRPDAGVGGRVPTLRDRLPEDLLAGPRGPAFKSGDPFSSVYQTHDEWAAELANKTVHAVLHIGWVPDESDGHHGQMAILVKPNGRLGTLYMAAIRPLRHLGVYPAMIRSIGDQWKANPTAPTAS